jgi:hypothetical protein
MLQYISTNGLKEASRRPGCQRVGIHALTKVETLYNAELNPELMMKTT